MTKGGAITSTLGAADSWVAARLDWLVWTIVAIGFYLRFQYAEGTYLNGDEALIMFPSLQHSWGDVYRAALTLPYTPFMNFGLRIMTLFGSSELYFRMPSIVAGAALPYVAYRWAGRLRVWLKNLSQLCCGRLDTQPER